MDVVSRSTFEESFDTFMFEHEMLKLSSTKTPKNKSTESNPTESKRANSQYVVNFPPGAMGLELEPVVTSSEREIGCRVKDFYFALDHVGMKVQDVKNNVGIGDIIVAINGENVLSSRFIDILDKLIRLKDKEKAVTFKDLSASSKYYIDIILSECD